MNQLHILVEGPDNVGKSTQIQSIKDHFNKHVFITLSHGKTKQSNADDYIKYNITQFIGMFETIANNEYIGFSTICDRSHIGEMVYAPMYRNYDGDYVYNIEKQYSDLDIVLILYTDKAENLISRDDGGSFSTDLNTKQEEIERFDDAFDMSTLKKIKITVTDKSIEEVTLETITKLKELYA